MRLENIKNQKPGPYSLQLTVKTADDQEQNYGIVVRLIEPSVEIQKDKESEEDYDYLAIVVREVTETGIIILDSNQSLQVPNLKTFNKSRIDIKVVPSSEVNAPGQHRSLQE